MSNAEPSRGPTPEATPVRGVGGGEGAPFTDGASLLDVLDRVLERGIVVEPSATGALPALDLTGGEATLTIASTQTLPAPEPGWAALAELVAATGAERAGAALVNPGADELWRSGEHAALKRQFERLNA